MFYAFTDGNGYYQVELSEGESLPAWTNALTPCDVVLTQPDQAQLITAKKQAVRDVREGILNRLAGIESDAGTTVCAVVTP